MTPIFIPLNNPSIIKYSPLFNFVVYSNENENDSIAVIDVESMKVVDNINEDNNHDFYLSSIDYLKIDNDNSSPEEIILYVVYSGDNVYGITTPIIKKIGYYPTGPHLFYRVEVNTKGTSKGRVNIDHLALITDKKDEYVIINYDGPCREFPTDVIKNGKLVTSEKERYKIFYKCKGHPELSCTEYDIKIKPKWNKVRGIYLEMDRKELSNQ